MIDRRNFVFGTASSLSVLPNLAAAQEQRLIVRTTGGAFEAALKANFFDPFTKATGIKVVPVAASAAEMLVRTAAMQKVGRIEWDVISPQYDELGILAPMLEDLGDCSSMPAISQNGFKGSCGRFGVLYLSGGYVLAHDPRAFPGGAPKTWSDFWDVKKFPGRRSLPNTGTPWAPLIAALVADGVDPQKLFPLDLDRAFTALDRIKPHISVWWKTGDQSQQMFRNGDVQLGQMWSGRAFATKRQGVPLAWTYRDAFADFGAWAVVKGAPNADAARKFIDFYFKNPEAHLSFSREIGYATPQVDASKLLTEQEKQELVSNEAAYNQIIHLNAEWVDKNKAAAVERWNRWIAS